MRQGRQGSGSGTNSATIGNFNERLVLSMLRRFGPASKADLARRSGLTNNAAGVIVRKLEEGGLVRSTGKRYGARGQPATMLELDPSGAFAIGVRIDRDTIQAVLVDLSATILDRALVEGLPPPEEAVARIAAIVRSFRRTLGAHRDMRLAGLGVAMPYNLGSWLVELDLPAAEYTRWDGFDLQGALARETGLTIILENDGSAAAVGELIHGHGREIEDFLYLFVGPAIGGGVVLQGNYLRGTHANAGDIAVVPVAPSRLASAPARGPHTLLMARASLNVLARHLRHAGANVGSTLDLDDAIARAPGAFEEWVEDAADALAWPVLTGIHLLDLDHVVIAGDLSPVHLQRLVDRVAAKLAAAVAESREPPRVMLGGVGRDAGAVGAASLPFHVSYSPMRELLTGNTPEAFLEVLS